MIEENWELFLAYARARAKTAFDAQERDRKFKFAEGLRGALESARQGGQWLPVLDRVLAPDSARRLSAPQHRLWLSAWASADEKSLREALIGFLDASLEPEARFERFARVAEEAEAAGRTESGEGTELMRVVLALGSLFNFALAPQDLPMILPILFERLERVLGYDPRSDAPVTERYGNHLAFARELLGGMRKAGFPVRDMVDVQSLIVIAAQERLFWAPDPTGDEDGRTARLDAIYRDEPPFLRERYESLTKYIALSREVPGWIRGDVAIALLQAASQLPPHAVIVEIGSFLGRSTVLLAGARKTAGSGRVHCVDPFDASGDDFSVPFYRAIADSLQAPLRQCFEENVRHADLSAWVEVHQGTAETIGENWNEPIDMLFLDGDHSPEGARSAYESWAPHLKMGGLIAVCNSADRKYEETHDGSRRLVVETVHPPQYADVGCVGSTTFARKVSQDA
jgi:predicted O-methyltransferase YrrM